MDAKTLPVHFEKKKFYFVDWNKGISGAFLCKNSWLTVNLELLIWELKYIMNLLACGSSKDLLGRKPMGKHINCTKSGWSKGPRNQPVSISFCNIFTIVIN